MNTNSLLSALIYLRRGQVLTPEASGAALRQLQGAPNLQGSSLLVGVPHWLVEQLENPHAARVQQFGMLSTETNENPVLMLAVQAGSTQLRLLMHLNHVGVQSLLRDAWSHRQLNVLLDIEHRSQVSILSSAMPDSMDGWLPRMFETVRDKPGQLARVLKLGAYYTRPQAVQSLIQSEHVSNVVTALVADEAGALSDDELLQLTSGEMDTEMNDTEGQCLH